MGSKKLYLRVFIKKTQTDNQLHNHVGKFSKATDIVPRLTLSPDQLLHACVLRFYLEFIRC